MVKKQCDFRSLLRSSRHLIEPNVDLLAVGEYEQRGVATRCVGQW
jgi:hypothetical protein